MAAVLWHWTTCSRQLIPNDFKNHLKVLGDTLFQIAHLSHCNTFGLRWVDLTTLFFVLSPTAAGKFESHTDCGFSGESICITWIHGGHWVTEANSMLSTCIAVVILDCETYGPISFSFPCCTVLVVFLPYPKKHRTLWLVSQHNMAWILNSITKGHLGHWHLLPALLLGQAKQVFRAGAHWQEVLT